MPRSKALPWAMPAAKPSAKAKRSLLAQCTKRGGNASVWMRKGEFGNASRGLESDRGVLRLAAPDREAPD